MSMLVNFENELAKLLNKYSQENGSDTPDFILAKYMNDCLTTWNRAVSARETWYGRGSRPVDAETARLLDGPCEYRYNNGGAIQCGYPASARMHNGSTDPIVPPAGRHDYEPPVLPAKQLSVVPEDAK